MTPETPLTLQAWNFAAEKYLQHLKTTKDVFQDHVNGPAILQLLPDIPNQALVDMGCGLGGFTKLIAKFHPDWNITGFDGAETLVNYARKHKPRNTKFFTHDIYDLSDSFPIENESCDLVLSKMVFPSLMNISPAITMAYRMLKDKGWFIISTLDDDYIQNYTYPKFENWFHFFARNLQVEVVSGMLTQEKADQFIDYVFKTIKSNPLAIWTSIAGSDFTIPIYSHDNDTVKRTMNQAGFKLIQEQFCTITREFADRDRRYFDRIGQKITWNTVWEKMPLEEKLSRSFQHILYNY